MTGGYINGVVSKKQKPSPMMTKSVPENTIGVSDYPVIVKVRRIHDHDMLKLMQ